MKTKILIIIGMILIASGIASANFGQSAGVLDFGNISIGENKTLSYFLVNTGEAEIVFEITHSEGIIVEPLEGTISPKSQMYLYVTPIATEPGNFGGKITATAQNSEEGAVVLKVALEKNFEYLVLEQVQSPEKGNNFLLFAGIAVLVMFLILFFVYNINKKGGKEIWKFGK